MNGLDPIQKISFIRRLFRPDLKRSRPAVRLRSTMFRLTNIAAIPAIAIRLSFHAFSVAAQTLPPGCTQADPANHACWPNEPSGSQLLTDWPFNALSGSGWVNDYPGSTCILTSDATAPLSPPNVMQEIHPFGSTGAGCQLGVSLNNNNSIYIGFWWKPSNPFDGYPNLHNKIIFVWSTLNSGGGPMYLSMEGQPGGPFNLMWSLSWNPPIDLSSLPGCVAFDSCNLYGNISNPVVTLGVWHHVEVYLKASTTQTSADGVIRWWLDGTSIGNYTTASFPHSIFDVFQITPAWDGGAGPEYWNGNHEFDQVRISAPGGGSSTTTPPAAPRGLQIL